MLAVAYLSFYVGQSPAHVSRECLLPAPLLAPLLVPPGWQLHAAGLASSYHGFYTVVLLQSLFLLVHWQTCSNLCYCVLTLPC